MCPLVSIVIPVYNVEKYLDRCVQSVINQTYKNLEIILVDDGSTDASPEICDGWVEKDNRISVIHKRNEGAGMARNVGIAQASGKYILFFDSDDFVDLQAVEKCVKIAEEHTCDVVLYGRGDAYSDGKVVEKDIRIEKEIFEHDEIKEELLPGLFTYKLGYGVSACDKMYKLDIIRKFNCRFPEEKGLTSEDACFNLEFLPHASRAGAMKDNLYFYYKREQSFSRTFRADRQEKNDAFFRKALGYVKDKNLPPKVETYITARYHIYTLSAMKQLVSSDLPKRERRARLKEILRSSVVRASLGTDVLRVHKKSLRIFYTLLKFRCYPLCKALLWLKNKN